MCAMIKCKLCSIILSSFIKTTFLSPHEMPRMLHEDKWEVILNKGNAIVLTSIFMMPALATFVQC